MTTKLLRDAYHVTQKDISDIFGIPMGTIKNWDARDCVPSYVFHMMENLLHLRYECKKYESEYKKDAFSARTHFAWDDIAYRALNITNVEPFEESKE